MEMVILGVLCAVSFLSGQASGHVNHRGSCPVPTSPMKDFQPLKFLGTWYVIEGFDVDATCFSMEYTSCGEGCLSVTEKKQLRAIDRILLSNVYQTDGTLVVEGTQPAVMTASFRTNPRSASYVVLGTDYETFALVYTCQNVGLDALPLYHRRDVYLLTRNRNATLDHEQMSVVSKALIENQIEDEFSAVSQTDCIKPEEASLDLNVSRIGNRVSAVASAVSSGISSFASAIGGLFSGGSSSTPDPAADGVAPLRRRSTN